MNPEVYFVLVGCFGLESHLEGLRPKALGDGAIGH